MLSSEKGLALVLPHASRVLALIHLVILKNILHRISKIIWELDLGDLVGGLESVEGDAVVSVIFETYVILTIYQGWAAVLQLHGGLQKRKLAFHLLGREAAADLDLQFLVQVELWGYLVQLLVPHAELLAALHMHTPVR